MGSLTAIQNEGYALIEQWTFTITNTGTSGTRVYLDTDSVLPNSTKETIPKIGDSWSDDYPDIICISIAVTYLNNSDECGKKIVCTYAPNFVTMEVEATASDDLPKYVDVGGEFLAWEPRDDTYYVEGSTPHYPIKQPLYKYIGEATFRLYRVIKTFDNYMLNSIMAAVNKTNEDEFLGFPAGMILFNGANLTEFRNRSGKIRWKCELTFGVRSVTGVFADGLDGWNYVFSEEIAEWIRPLTEADDSPLYQETTFSDIFEADPLGDDEDLFESIPDQ